jgi:hypothetical protein
MADVIVPVQRRQQENLYFCGPATAQMVLAALGVPTPPVPPSWQKQLWDYITQHTGANRPDDAPDDPYAFDGQKCEWCAGEWNCWTTTPGVLAALLNQQLIGSYAIAKHSSEESATGALLDTIDQQLPAVALVYGWMHWLVVDGYRHSRPNAEPVAGRQLNGVYIRNPEKGRTGHYVRWAKWQTSYLWFIACGQYKNKMVTLPGRRAVPGVRSVTSPMTIAQPPMVTPSTTARDPWTLPMKTLITSSAAMSKALEQLDDFRTSRLGPGLLSAEPRSALLVQRLDDPDLYYYIVTFQTGGRDTARAIVDAFDGNLDELEAIEETGEDLTTYLPAPAALQRLRKETERAADVLRFRVRDGLVGEHPVLVWKPCLQSRSPFLPFYQLSVGDSFVYYRVDGERFSKLTTRPA